jgi:hypothetical protein
VIALRFEEVIVQKESARPVSCVHSFAMWRAPLRAEDTEDADAVGARASARAVRARIVVATETTRAGERMMPVIDPTTSN